MRKFEWLAALGIVVAVSGCKEASSAKFNGAETFTFQPKENLAYTRKVRWVRELSIEGSPLRRQDELLLTWRGNLVLPGGGTYLLDEQLEDLSVKLNGAEIARAPKSWDSRIHLKANLDKTGKAVRLEGTDEAAKAILELVPAEARGRGAQEAIRASLEDLAATRIDERTADLVGRPAKLGETWTVAIPDAPDLKREYTVVAAERCVFGECARVDSTIQIDPKLVAASVQEVINELLGTDEGAKIVAVKEATFTEKSSLVVDPRTLAHVGAKDSSEGDFTFAGKARALKVILKNTKEVEVIYDTPAPRPPPR